MSSVNSNNQPYPNATSAPSTHINYGYATDVGLIRAHNEDCILVNPPVFAICDGMGGHNAGEVASQIAVDVLDRNAPRTPDTDALDNAVCKANVSILNAASEGVGREGMGTTCTCAVIDGDRIAIAQVGDSRAYLLHNYTLQQITHDHSIVADLVDNGEITAEEARTHPMRSYITRALGLDPRIQPDTYELNAEDGDRLMLCSDGLYSMVDDHQIGQILSTSPTCQNAADRLIDAANAAGGADNVSVIVIGIEGGSTSVRKKFARKAKITAGIVIALLLVAFIACGVALNFVTTNSAYLGEVDGRVAIYQGIPGEIAGLSFSHLYEVTNVYLDDIQPGTARRISANDIRCESLEAAQNLVNDYAQNEHNSRTPKEPTNIADDNVSDNDSNTATKANTAE